MSTVSDTNLNRKPSHKVQKQNYLAEKHKAAQQFLDLLNDPSVIILSDWLKVRGSLKGWTKLYCILKPGVMILYNNTPEKNGKWVGTILLTSCHVIERPSKKAGFCFKIFHSMGESIWTSKGPKGETIGALTIPLPSAYLIFRATNEDAGKCWMDAINLATQCSNLLLRSMTKQSQQTVDAQQKTSNTSNSALYANLRDRRLSQTQAVESDEQFPPKPIATNKNMGGEKRLSKKVTAKKTSEPYVPTALTQHSLDQDFFDAAQNSHAYNDLHHVDGKDVQYSLIGAKKYASASRLNYTAPPTSIPTVIKSTSESQQYVVKSQQHGIRHNNKLPMLEDKMSLLSSSHSSASEASMMEDFSTSNASSSRISLSDTDTKDQSPAVQQYENGMQQPTLSATKEHPTSEQQIQETPYIEDIIPDEDITMPSDKQNNTAIEETLPDENKSLIWALVKQMKPGMDLSKVTLPTFILEPRSFLDKLTDYYYHSDILAQAQNMADPYSRIKLVTKWYLSGFYKKPKGLKKPYNPVIGEIFRCMWINKANDSKTFYIAEQVSHHPPISAFYVTNRKDGYSLSGTILTRSKFYGNSVSAILDGSATLTLLPRGERYIITMPYANCKGILVGNLTMELGGKIVISCPHTGYSSALEFKLKPMFGGVESSNVLSGKIKFGETAVMAKIEGHWDGKIFIKEMERTSTAGTLSPASLPDKKLLWNALDPQITQSRLPRYTVPLTDQKPFESAKLWIGVTNALKIDDQNAATLAKTEVENAQREKLSDLQSKGLSYEPMLFQTNEPTNEHKILLTNSLDNSSIFDVQEWAYKYRDYRPWDPLNDLYQYEKDFIIQTQTIPQEGQHLNLVRTLTPPDASKRNIPTVVQAVFEDEEAAYHPDLTKVIRRKFDRQSIRDLQTYPKERDDQNIQYHEYPDLAKTNIPLPELTTKKLSLQTKQPFISFQGSNYLTLMMKSIWVQHHEVIVLSLVFFILQIFIIYYLRR